MEPELNVYTEAEEAGIECRKRWANKKLKAEVEKFLGGDIPEPFLTAPRAGFGRDIMTPNREFFSFLRQAHKSKLEYFLSEYPKGIFVTQNLDKYYLGKLVFYNKKGKKGGDRLSVERIIDFNTSNKQELRNIKTLWGEWLHDVHKRFFQEAAPIFLSSRIYDLTEWFERKGGSAKNYYAAYLALFIAHGVLFETYLTDDPDERVFLEKVVYPTINDLKKRFGVAPLIVRTCETEELSEFKERWMHYPEFLKKSIMKKIENSNS